jgi:hypothetical protein
VNLHKEPQIYVKRLKERRRKRVLAKAKQNPGSEKRASYPEINRALKKYNSLFQALFSFSLSLF